jgi:uncharacterized membrane protein YbhN (UPF0104 family)
MLSIVTGFYNLITPAKGGMIIRAAYLKTKHKLTYTNFLASLAGMYVIAFFVGSLLGLISLFIIHETTSSFSLLILLAFSAVFLPLLFIILFSPKFREVKSKFFNRFIRVANGWNLIRKDRKVVLTCLFVTFMSILTSTVSTMVSYYIFGVNISFVSALFLCCIGSLGIIIQITPGNLGVAEAIGVFSALIIGIAPTQSISVAILGRIVQMLVMFSLGPIFSYKLLKQKSKSSEKQKI